MSQPALSYIAQEVRQYNRNRFLQSLFAFTEAREALLTLYALEVELDHIHQAVREEMIGHIRYAWWQESIEALYDGKPARGHPVLEALIPVIRTIPKEQLLALVETYRTHFPELPPDSRTRIDAMAENMLQWLSPKSVPRIKKAGNTIARHLKRHPQGWNSWLALKLLLRS